MAELADETLLDRALRNLREGWREIARAAPIFGTPEPRPDLAGDDAADIREHMRACLDARGGEVSARGRAASLGETYLGLNEIGRRRFLEILARDFSIDHAAAVEAAAALIDATDERGRMGAEAELRGRLSPPRVRLLTQFNALPSGVKFLVDLRADLLTYLRQESDPALSALDADLRALLRSWFDVGFLDLKRITWDSSAALLEKLIAYEAVHEIESWDDLKNRLDGDRRCFAFFHNRMPDEPLIFVEVTLVDGVAGNIRDLLDTDAPETDPERAKTAIFYSITNAQKGLAGISFGNFLIKQVVDSLAAEFPGLRTFATLSPVPGFMAWLRAEVTNGGVSLVTETERKALARAGVELGSNGELLSVLDDPSWIADRVYADLLKSPLMRACARYLVHAKREDGRALDPVANFHLSNGARIETLNWLGDDVPKGLRQSAGIMVNYLYDLDKIAANHEAYRGQGQIAASSAIRSMAKT